MSRIGITSQSYAKKTETVRHVWCHAPSQLFNISQLIGGSEASKLRLIVGTNRIRLHLCPIPSLIWLPAELVLRPAVT